MKNLGIVVVAGGSSSRFGERDKLLLEIDNSPLFLSCIKTFLKVIPAANIVVVTSQGREKEFAGLIEKHLGVDIKTVTGGKERSDSSLNGLRTLPAELEYAGVHDAARPYISVEALEKCMNQLKLTGSAVLAHPVTDTIKVAAENGLVTATPPRSTLFAAETPQIFEKEKLVQAYLNPPEGIVLTDESMAMEQAGHSVSLVIHEEDNRKITYEKDLR